MSRYRKKPVEIEAMPLPSEPDQAAVRKVAEWMADNGYREDGYPDVNQVDPMHRYGDIVLAEYGSNFLTIATLEGEMNASLGDFIIQGVQGEFYPCKPDIFEATYEETR